MAQIPSQFGTASYAALAAAPDGRIAIVGTYYNAAGILDPSTGLLQVLPNTITARPWPGLVVLSDGRIAVFGGLTSYASNPSGSPQAEIYDPTSNSWTPIDAPDLDARTSALSLPDGRILVSATTGSYVWDPVTAAIETVTGTGGGNSLLLASDGFVYGVDNEQIYQFDIATMTWSDLASVPVSSSPLNNLFQVDPEHLLVVGGGSPSWRGTTALINLADLSTQQIDPFPNTNPNQNTQIGGAGQLADGTIMLFGIAGGYGSQEIYQPATQSWGSMPNSSPITGWTPSVTTSAGLYMIGDSSSSDNYLTRFTPGPYVTGIPEAPTIIPQACCDNGVSFGWAPLLPPHDGNLPITGYEVIRHAADGDFVTSLSGSTTTFQEASGIGVGDTYTVRALNALGTGPESAPFDAVESDAPGPIQNLAATSQGNVTLTWDPPDNDGGSPIVGYDVLRADKYVGGSYPFGGTVVTGTTYTDSSVTVGSNYDYYVFPRNQAGLDALTMGEESKFVDISVTVTPPSSTTPPTFTSDTPPTTATVGSAMTPYTFAASGTPASTFSVTNGSLPSGLSLDPSSGALSGTPTVSGSYSFDVVASNGVDPDADSGQITIVVSGPAGSDSADAGSTTSPTTPAVTSDGSTTATASGGAGTVVVAQYPSQPPATATPTFASVGTSPSTSPYFDVKQTPGSTFSNVVVTNCVPSGVNALYWFNPNGDGGAGAWQPVVGDPGPTFTSNAACASGQVQMSVTLDSTSSPTVSQLTGTVFALGVPSSTTTTFATTTPTKISYGQTTLVAVVVTSSGALQPATGDKIIISAIPGGSTTAVATCTATLTKGAQSSTGSCLLPVLAAGSYVLGAVFQGSSISKGGDLGFTTSSGTGLLTVAKAPTVLRAKVISVVKSLLTLQTSFSATLTSSVTGSGISGETVSFTELPGKVTCTAITNASGVATCSVSVLNLLALILAPTYNAVYAGTANYVASTSAGGVSIP